MSDEFVDLGDLLGMLRDEITSLRAPIDRHLPIRNTKQLLASMHIYHPLG